MGCRCFNTHVRNTRSLASPRVSTSPKGSAQSLSQLGPTAQWGRLRKRGDDRINSLHRNVGHMATSRGSTASWPVRRAVPPTSLAKHVRDVHSERSTRPRSHRTLPTIVNVILAQSPCTAALANGPGGISIFSS